jgi:Protein of unknown function (DUF4012)
MSPPRRSVNLNDSYCLRVTRNNLPETSEPPPKETGPQTSDQRRAPVTLGAMFPFLAVADGYAFSQGLLGLSVGFAVVVVVAAALPDRPAREPADTVPSVTRLTRLCAAALVALIGAFSGAAPTGTRFLDIPYCAVFGFVLFVMVDSLSNRAMFIAAVPAVAYAVAGGTWTLPGALACFAPLGGVLALHVFRRNSTLAHLICAGGLSVGVFHYPTGVRSLLPSATAALVTVGAVIGWVIATVRTYGAVSGRRRGRWAAVAGGAFGIVAVGAGAVGALREVKDTRQHLERTVKGLTDAMTPIEALDVHAGEAALSRVGPELRASEAKLSSPMWRLAKIVPVAAQNAKAVRGLVDNAQQVVADAGTVITTDQLHQLRRTDGSIDIRSLEDVMPKLTTLETALVSLRSSVATAQGPWIVNQVQQKASTFGPKVDKALRQVSAAKKAGANLPEILGADRARTYLLVFPSPSEARGSGGLIGNWGELKIDNGAISLVRFDRIVTLIDDSRPWQERADTFPPGYLTRYSAYTPKQYFQNLLVSPDFPTNAEVMVGQYKEATGRDVDGVVSVDPYGLAAVLALEGPLTVPTLPDAVTSETAPKTLLYDLYVAAGDSQNGRIRVLEDIARGTFERVRTIPIDTPQRLVDTLGPAFRQRHIQMWSKSPGSERYLDSIGAGGRYLIPEDPDSPVELLDTVGLISQNAGGNKIDWFGGRTLDYRVAVDDEGVINATATLDIANRAPADGLPDYIIGNVIEVRKVPRGTATTIFSLYSRLDLQSATVFGEPVAFQRDTEFGLQVYTLTLEIPAKSHETLTVKLTGRTTANAATRTLHTRRGVRVLYQPQVNPDTVSVTIGTQEVVSGVSLPNTETFSTTAG